MAERQNTIVCSFDPASPRITAYDIHEWIHDTLRIPEKIVNMNQIDGPKRQVYIKLAYQEYVQALIRDTRGIAEYTRKHNTGNFHGEHCGGWYGHQENKDSKSTA
jgi:hypothetical protein